MPTTGSSTSKVYAQQGTGTHSHKHTSAAEKCRPHSFYTANHTVSESEGEPQRKPEKERNTNGRAQRQKKHDRAEVVDVSYSSRADAKRYDAQVEKKIYQHKIHCIFCLREKSIFV